MSVAVVSFPGSNCDQDARKAVKQVTGREASPVWHTERLPAGTKLVVLPGGFSYGDYLRCGAIARFSPVMDSIREFAAAGGAVLGICNGFQILLESGMLPGAMLRNRDLHFRCEWVHLSTQNNTSLFTDRVPPVLRIPIAHGEGNWHADDETLAEIERRGQVVFRYCSPEGHTTQEANPNGSRNNVAGLLNEQGNVMGMMPHPERAMDADLGGIDGIAIWDSVCRKLGLKN